MRPRRLVERHQPFRIPMLGLPQVVHLHETHLGRMPVVFDMLGIILGPLDVHVPRIPVPFLRHALRGPVRPDAELGITEPIRHVITAGERFPCRFERPGSNLLRRHHRRLCRRRLTFHLRILRHERTHQQTPKNQSPGNSGRKTRHRPASFEKNANHSNESPASSNMTAIGVANAKTAL
jgi:hypothetical protein